MWKVIRPYLRNIYRSLISFKFFFYDYFRYIKFSGWKENFDDIEVRNYKSVILYHGLEKSLSYKVRNPNSGWNNAYQILELLKIANKNKNLCFHEKVSKIVLEKFLNLTANINNEKTQYFREELKKLDIFNENYDEPCGYIEYPKNNYEKGILDNPEDFFFSRYSLREFKNEIVRDIDIKRALNLAIKTPSVCNRQPWAIYHTSKKEIKDILLTYQQGNKPFGENIPNLIIVAADLKAFFAADEHYQHWIDGGLLSMSIMYAFHSIGIATCPLNWSAKPKNDLGLRKSLNIKDNHTIIMVLAVGYPDENNKVCVSPRKTLDDIFYNLEKK